jgi:hypothetical protein
VSVAADGRFVPGNAWSRSSSGPRGGPDGLWFGPARHGRTSAGRAATGCRGWRSRAARSSRRDVGIARPADRVHVRPRSRRDANDVRRLNFALMVGRGSVWASQWGRGARAHRRPRARSSRTTDVEGAFDERNTFGWSWPRIRQTWFGYDTRRSASSADQDQSLATPAQSVELQPATARRWARTRCAR